MRFSIPNICLLLILFHLPGRAEEPDLWSLQPVRSPAIPGDSDAGWARTDLDRLIRAGLDTAGLRPVADADAETLVRRLYFNLIGLPPNPEEIDRFAAAHANDPATAMEALADELLASPHFGEKWARHWLDVARYADSNGKDRDIVFPWAWTYRDYVIGAFNADKPVDTFVREQIAGDLLPEAGDEQITATAFMALGPKPFMERDAERFRLEIVDEQIDVVSRSILGLTIACARCHDHKFDPVSTRDYYALAGILLSSDTRYGPAQVHSLVRTGKDTELIPVGERAEELHSAFAAWRGEVNRLLFDVIDNRLAANPVQRELRLGMTKHGIEKPEDHPEVAELKRRLDRLVTEREVMEQTQRELMASPPAEPPVYTMAMLRSGEPPEDCAVRIRGEPDDHGERVPRGDLKIPGMPGFGAVSRHESGRLQLADWLTSAENPLTARVFVNRVWHHLFGAGLVRTVDNFGATGEAPSHPELLDFLAAEFVADGWSLKNLVRRIVLSRTWQLTSDPHPANAANDPGNRLLWRANYRRLDIEQFRDAVLCVSGELIRTPARGSLFQSVYPGFDYGDPNPHTVNLDAEIAAERHRTVYLPVARTSVPVFLSLFDFADPWAPTGARNSRSIPAQALFLMNNPFMDEQARAAADRILELPPAERLETVWRMSTGRKPDAETSDLLESWLADRGDADGWTDLMQVLFASSPFRYLD